MSKARNCWNSRTRGIISLAAAERGWDYCSRCGQAVKIQVHRPKKEGDAHEGTLATHPESAPQRNPAPDPEALQDLYNFIADSISTNVADTWMETHGDLPWNTTREAVAAHESYAFERLQEAGVSEKQFGKHWPKIRDLAERYTSSVFSTPPRQEWLVRRTFTLSPAQTKALLAWSGGSGSVTDQRIGDALQRMGLVAGEKQRTYEPKSRMGGKYTHYVEYMATRLGEQVSKALWQRAREFPDPWDDAGWKKVGSVQLTGDFLPEKKDRW